ncbi:YfeC-like transcriptional regulator [Shigella flexneri]
MTPDGLRPTRDSRQTINKWVRKEGWREPSPKPGVQGGKAHGSRQ